MATSTIVLIVVAVAAILVVAALAWVLQRKRTEHRRLEAGSIRDRAAEQAHHVGQREALADETAAKARGAQAQADANAAQAAGLQHRAATRRSEAVSSREEVNQEFERADRIDPDSQTRETTQGPDRSQRNDRTGAQSPRTNAAQSRDQQSHRP